MIERIAWVLLSLVHLTPALALFRPALLTRLYCLPVDSPLFLLMQHRAVLFLVIVVIALWCAVDPAPRRLGSVALALSMGGFLMLWLAGGSPPALRTIAVVDAIGLLPLAYVAWRAFVHAPA
ncbi:hypothetical protein [Sandaracinobacteroides saxicola]|uniref:Phosphopantetheine adenylyltransferase n=1 Tax=Sandaracinobacteroides saxicola TaxID=2759707 RepID=A0A7G5IDS9_9SPHN|nr:hypothetical protein [Sandaracinobacteroides saxicola]QMW21521.1 hypothetical protein H3309_08780 [Sandaracinobacteroides saxicola]